LRIAPRVAVQPAIWLAIKAHLSHVFVHDKAEGGGVAGGLFVSKLGYNLRELPEPQEYRCLPAPAASSCPSLS
jgi:hypothetical protein